MKLKQKKIVDDHLEEKLKDKVGLPRFYHIGLRAYLFYINNSNNEFPTIYRDSSGKSFGVTLTFAGSTTIEKIRVDSVRIVLVEDDLLAKFYTFSIDELLQRDKKGI